MDGFIKLFCILLGMGIGLTFGATNQRDHRTSPIIDNQLKLSKDQKERIREVRRNKKRLVYEYQDAVELARFELQKALQSNASDTELEEKFRILQSTRAELSKVRFQHILKMRGVLTSEQQKKFEEIKSYTSSR